MINDNCEYIITKLKEEKEKIERIKFDSFIKPKIDDDLNNKKDKIEILFNLETKYKINLIDISFNLLGKYFIIHENNINELVCLFQITKMIALNKGVFKYALISTKIFNKLNIYAKEKKSMNMNLLLFIETMPNKLRHFDITILENINIDKINEDFS